MGGRCQSLPRRWIQGRQGHPSCVRAWPSPQAVHPPILLRSPAERRAQRMSALPRCGHWDSCLSPHGHSRLWRFPCPDTKSYSSLRRMSCTTMQLLPESTRSSPVHGLPPSGLSASLSNVQSIIKKRAIQNKAVEGSQKTNFIGIVSATLGDEQVHEGLGSETIIIESHHHKEM